MSGSGNGGGQRPPAANPDSLFQRMAKAFGGIPGALSELYSDLGPKGFGLILLAFLAGIVLTNFRPSWLVFGYEPEPGGSGAAEVVSVEPEASFSFDRKEENGQDLVTIEPALQWVTSGVWSADK